MVNTDIKKQFKSFLLENDLTITKIVDIYNEQHPDNTTTRQNLTNKLSRQTLQYKELLLLLDSVGFDVRFIKRE